MPKTHVRVIAYGSTDELNSVIGVARAAGLSNDVDRLLRQIQNDLFDVGADLCVPPSDASPSESGKKPRANALRVSDGQIASLEQAIDSATERLEPLTSFVLPGGTVAAAHLHHARTVCRRAEIDVLRLTAAESVNPNVAIYLNRLSDLLFVLARVSNSDGKDDVLWVPGQNSESSENGPNAQ